MKIKPIAFSFIVSFSIAFLFLLVTFWVFYKYSGSVASAKDALSTVGSYFGAASTLGSAIIAAYLFTDWRDNQKYQNATRASEFLYVASDAFLGSYDKYIKAIWAARSNPDTIIDLNSYFEDFRKKENDLKVAIHVCEINFNSADVNFDQLKNHLNKIDVALREILPFSLKKNNIGYVEEKYLNEDMHLTHLSIMFSDLLLKEIRYPLSDFLLKKALT